MVSKGHFCCEIGHCVTKLVSFAVKSTGCDSNRLFLWRNRPFLFLFWNRQVWLWNWSILMWNWSFFSWILTQKFSKSTVLGKMSFFCWKSIVTNWITFNDISKLTGNDPKLSNCYVEYEKCISKSCKLMIFGRAGFFLIFLIRFWRFLKNKNCLCWIKNIRVYVNLKCFSI